MGGMSKLKYTSALATSAAMGFLGLAPNAQGADSDSAPAVGIEGGDRQLEEVMVTARRRTERQQDVPIAISAFNNEMLERNNITEVEDLSGRVPGMQISNSTAGGESNPIFMIRGQSQAEASSVADPSVSLYVNDIPVPRASGANIGFYDIASVEVLKGPQGTLFGRNTTGGAILVRTEQPVHDFEASLSQMVGNYNAFTTEGMLNLPVGDAVALRFAGSLARRDGYITDVVTGRDVNFRRNQSGRVSLLIEPGDSGLRSLTVGSYSRIRNGPTGSYVYFSLDPLFQAGLAEQAARDPFHVASGLKPRVDVDLWTIENNTSFELNDNFTLRNIAGYRQFDFHMVEDSDGTREIIFNVQKTIDHHQLSNELQLLGSFDNFDFVAGGFYFRERADDQAPSVGALVGVPISPDPVIEPDDIRDFFPRYSNTWALATNTSYAAFAQGTYKFTPEFSFTAGLRYSIDKRMMTQKNRTYIAALSTTDQSCRFTLDEDNDPATPETRPSIGNCHYGVSKTFEEPTYNLSLDYRVTPDALVYVAHRHGYRSGGFGPRGATQVGIEEYFEPEIVNDFEVGIKADWNFGDAFLRTNLAAYTSNYKDMQRYVIVQISPPVSSTDNAARAKVQGIELDAIFRPIPMLEFNGFYSYTHAEFKEYRDGVGNDLSGQMFPRTQRNQWGINARLTLPFDSGAGEIAVGLGARHQDEYDASDGYNIEVDAAGNPIPSAIAYNQSEIIPGHTLWNAGLDWMGVMGSNVDFSAFIDNLTDRTWYGAHQMLTGRYSNRVAGEPRTYGIRLRVHFD